MKKYIVLVIVFFTIQKATTQFSQLKNAEEEFGVWYMYNGSHKVSDKFSLKTMAHFRFFEIGVDMQQFIGRIGANYKIDKTVSVTLGYAFLETDRSFNVTGDNFGDHRIYADLNIKHKISDLSIAHRLRPEQRFFESETGQFIRYQLSLSYPLSKKWSTYVYDEVFFDTEGEPYNQNWFGAGFKYQLSKVVKLQLGYMYINTQNDRNFDRIQIGIAISTDHRKKKEKK